MKELLDLWLAAVLRANLRAAPSSLARSCCPSDFDAAVERVRVALFTGRVFFWTARKPRDMRSKYAPRHPHRGGPKPRALSGLTLLTNESNVETPSREGNRTVPDRTERN